MVFFKIEAKLSIWGRGCRWRKNWFSERNTRLC